MKQYFFIAALAAAVLAGCAKNETYVKVSNNYDDAVSFSAYSGRTITKAGCTDDMNLEALKKAEAGFGVFATYSGTDNFSEATDNFMYNEKITWNGNEWSYSPVKYWPNPTNGQSADAQKVSFFAYAPYAAIDPAVAETSGITGFSIDATTHHNMLHYTFSNDKNVPNVDLMWGYKTKNVDNSTNPATVTYDINTNLTRTTDKVAFIFQHLLSKLGGSQEGAITDPTDPNYVANGLIIKANAETIAPTNNFGENNGTKITVSEIILQSAPEEDPVGTPVLDANGNEIHYAANQTGKLDLYTGEFVLDNAAAPVQFKQVLSADPDDVTAKTADSEIADIIKEPTTEINVLSALPTGVTTTAVNVYKDESSPIILIPGTAPVVDVTITYTVRTYDEKLSNGTNNDKKYTEVPQTVWGRVKFPTIEKNKKYNLLMILGLNDVKFEATVEDWALETTWVDTDGDGVKDDDEIIAVDQEIGLPNNLPLFDLVSAATVVVDANGDGETDPVYTEAAENITITNITKGGNAFDNSADNFTINTTNKTIVLDNVATGVYVLTIEATDDHHDVATKTITLTVNNS